MPTRVCPGARFDGIAPGLEIGTALHAAKIIVDEEGAEAAAATVQSFPTSAGPEPKEIVVDEPFLWVIMDEQTGAILFVGRLMDPTTT